MPLSIIGSVASLEASYGLHLSTAAPVVSEPGPCNTQQYIAYLSPTKSLTIVKRQQILYMQGSPPIQNKRSSCKGLLQDFLYLGIVHSTQEHLYTCNVKNTAHFSFNLRQQPYRACSVWRQCSSRSALFMWHRRPHTPPTVCNRHLR